MAKGYNSITLVGYVGTDPESRFLNTGTQVANFTVAHNDYKDNVTWFRVTAMGKLAEIVSQYVTKGRQVLVVGEVNLRAWKGKDGEERTTLEITASEVKLLGRREEGADNGGAAPTPIRRNQPRAGQNSPAVDIDDLPF